MSNDKTMQERMEKHTLILDNGREFEFDLLQKNEGDEEDEDVFNELPAGTYFYFEENGRLLVTENTLYCWTQDTIMSSDNYKYFKNRICYADENDEDPEDIQSEYDNHEEMQLHEQHLAILKYLQTLNKSK